MVSDCPIHGGNRNPEQRDTLDPIVKELPESQAGEGRHKCAYCAYVRGLEDARQAAARKIAKWLCDE